MSGMDLCDAPGAEGARSRAWTPRFRDPIGKRRHTRRALDAFSDFEPLQPELSLMNSAVS